MLKNKEYAKTHRLGAFFANRMGVNVDKNPVKTQKSTQEGVRLRFHLDEGGLQGRNYPYKPEFLL